MYFLHIRIMPALLCRAGLGGSLCAVTGRVGIVVDHVSGTVYEVASRVENGCRTYVAGDRKEKGAYLRQ